MFTPEEVVYFVFVPWFDKCIFRYEIFNDIGKFCQSHEITIYVTSPDNIIKVICIDNIIYGRKCCL